MPSDSTHIPDNHKPKAKDKPSGYKDSSKELSMDSSEHSGPDTWHKHTTTTFTDKPHKGLPSEAPIILTDSFNETTYSIVGGENNHGPSVEEPKAKSSAETLPVPTEVAEANSEILSDTGEKGDQIGLHSVSHTNENRTQNTKTVNINADKDVYLEEGTTDDEDLLIEGSADYDGELPPYSHKDGRGHGRGHHKNHRKNNEAHNPGDLKYPDRESNAVSITLF